MGENESTVEIDSPPGLFLNGLLPGEALSVTRPLDAERWAEAEDRTAQLIACIQPNPPSEHRRNAVARYVRRLIMECFPHQVVEVFTFGSVPLKTYLPDGDIDLTAFSTNQNLKDSWAYLVRDMLEWEEKNENAEFHVKEVQYIQAEVKLIKCVVEDIVVDISFNQLGGLCTLCFLEEVDHHINQNHLFKRSIILIKAWCYNESRILGSHHGLISTYALETLVLYIFHVFNNSFSGPLEVLYRFLEFFSKFDWQNFCISLWGPVPVSSLPDVTAKPPRRDVEELRDSEAFLKACSRLYAVNPAAQEIQGQPFVSKHFNIIDPLRENNNLGRSVSKGNFFRIRSAFTLGAKKLARLLECPKENLINEVNQFFLNTWERHGSGRRPDAPGNDLWLSRLGDPEPNHQAETGSSSSTSKRKQNGARLGEVHGARSMPSQRNNCGTGYSKSYQAAQEVSSNQIASTDKLQQTVKPEIMVNNFQGRHLFARTQSSPEFPETYLEALLQSRRSIAQEAGKRQNSSTTADNIRKKNLESETLSSNVRYSADSSSARHSPSPRSPDSTADMRSAVNSYYDDLGSVSELSIQVDDDNREWATVSNDEITEGDLGPQHTIASFQAQRHHMQGHEPAQVSGSESTTPLTPFLLGHGMQQSEVDHAGYNFDPTVPPVPAFMLPFYNYEAGGNATSDGLANHHSVDEGVENHDQSEMVSSSHSPRIGSSVEPTEHTKDILVGDFTSHWHQYQYGRSCQNSQHPHMLFSVPPGFLQGRLPWDGPGRPHPYTNVANQLMTYGPHLVPVAQQPVSTRPPNIYPRYGNESPRYRNGTGTYFPNPKLSPREPRPASGTRRGNYRRDRNEHHNDDREGTWFESFSHI